MNARKEADLNMQRAVEQHLDTNTTIIAAVPAFVTAFNLSKGISAQIVATIGGQEAVRTGITEDKQVSKDQLIDAALRIAKPTRAYASVIGDNTLRDEVDYSRSELNRLREDQLAPRCQIIYDRAFANKDALKDYGVTDVKLTALLDAINAFSADVPKPRAARADRPVKTANLRDLFRQNNQVLDRMDDLIDNFADDPPDFVATYKQLRKIDKPASTTTQLKGKVTNAANASPVNDATVTVVEAAKTAQTDSGGNYNIKPLPAGKYTIRVTKTGFTDFEASDVDVKLGQITTLDVELEGN